MNKKVVIIGSLIAVLSTGCANKQTLFDIDRVEPTTSVIGVSDIEDYKMVELDLTELKQAISSYSYCELEQQSENSREIISVSNIKVDLRSKVMQYDDGMIVDLPYDIDNFYDLWFELFKGYEISDKTRGIVNADGNYEFTITDKATELDIKDFTYPYSTLRDKIVTYIFSDSYLPLSASLRITYEVDGVEYYVENKLTFKKFNLGYLVTPTTEESTNGADETVSVLLDE